MKIPSKLALITVSIIAATGLSACQSTASQVEPQTENQNNHKHRHHAAERHQHDMKKMSTGHDRPHSAGRQQMFEQMQAACSAKSAGQNIAVKMGEKNIAGQCKMGFSPNDIEQLKLQQRTAATETRTPPLSRADWKNMNAEQRQQYEQQRQERRQLRQQQWENMQAQCAGQTAGKAVQIKIGQQSIDGTCQLKFHPDRAAIKATKLTPSSST